MTKKTIHNETPNKINLPILILTVWFTILGCVFGNFWISLLIGGLFIVGSILPDVDDGGLD